MAHLKQLIHEIHRRSLWQVLGIYLVASWLVFQVVQTLTEGLGLPDWVPPIALILLLIGLPIVLATAFVQEGGGARGEEPNRASMAPGEVPSAADTGESAELAASGGAGSWRSAGAGGAAVSRDPIPS